MRAPRQNDSYGHLRRLDLVEYLASLGHAPQYIRKGFEYWYLSPLRSENTPSFKVNRAKNRWFDFGLFEGGDLIDFARRYHQCSLSELLKKDIYGEPAALQVTATFRRQAESRENGIVLKAIQPIHSGALIDYLHERHIPQGVASRFCKEAHYEIGGRQYFAIAFGNDQGGYELRNRFFKGSTSPKAITSLPGDGGEVSVFEGFMDFLSYQTLTLGKPAEKSAFVVLNGAALFERARPFLERHQAIRLYFDRDATGDHYTEYACGLSEKYRDKRELFSGAKDLNQWLMSAQVSQKRRFPRL